MKSARYPTQTFGQVDVPVSKEIWMPFGMIGFPEDKRYVLLKGSEDSSILHLQSLTKSSMSFPVTIPYFYYWDYEAKVQTEDLELLNVTHPSDICLLSVINMSRDVPTLNLFSPIVLNERNMQAKQCINTAGSYSTRDPLFVGDARVTSVHGEFAPTVLV